MAWEIRVSARFTDPKTRVSARFDWGKIRVSARFENRVVTRKTGHRRRGKKPGGSVVDRGDRGGGFHQVTSMRISNFLSGQIVNNSRGLAR